VYKKITTGCVIQCFNGKGECISQRFIIPDSGTVEYEWNGEPIGMGGMPLLGDEYYPFSMEQPKGKL